MAMQLRVDDRIQCAHNFATWKERITRILDISDVEEHIDSTKVAPTNPADLASWKKIDSRAMLIIMDGVKDHISITFLVRRPQQICGQLWRVCTKARTRTGRWCYKRGCTAPRWPREKE